MNELALFSGIGGGLLGSRLLGWRTVCAVEIEPFCIDRIMQRQNEGHLDRFPIWDDIRTFDGKPWRGIVDVVSGGFPCQDISVAGKGAGIEGERSGLWSEMARVIGEVRPKYAFVENTPALLVRGIDRVLGDLAEMGYDARWGIISAENAGAPHERKRIWIFSYSNSVRELQQKRIEQNQWRRPCYFCEKISNATGQRLQIRSEKKIAKKRKKFKRFCSDRQKWETEPGLGRVAHGVADRVDRLKAIGNGQVPQVAKLAWEILAA